MFAMTYSDMQTAADKCEETEEGYTQCSQFLYGTEQLDLCALITAFIYPVSLGDRSKGFLLFGKAFCVVHSPGH